LLRYIREGRENSVSQPEVFLTSRPPFHPLRSSAALSQIIRDRLLQAQIGLPEGVSRGTHSFRHGFATRLTGKLPLKHIADMLGHRDLASTFIYSKVDLQALRETALPWPEEDAP
jgi:site-specific recombinase XerD